MSNLRERAKVGSTVIAQELDGKRTPLKVAGITICSIFTEDGRAWRRKSGLAYQGAWSAMFLPYLMGLKRE